MSKFVDEITKTNVENILLCGTNFSRWWKEDSLIIANVLSYKSIDFVLRSILS